MTDDTYDDGLVHAHGWATEPPRATAARTPTAYVPVEADGYDDGLVHSHDWARTA